MNVKINEKKYMPGTTYIIGLGIAGLSAAVNCLPNGNQIRLLEATKNAGGRCRSFNDQLLSRTINNGTHLILSGNVGIKEYLKIIGASHTFQTIKPASFKFIDIKSGLKWEIKPSVSRIPWWIFRRKTRIPDTALMDYLPIIRFKFSANKTIADLVNTSRPIFDRLWQPLSRAVLNTDAYEGSASSIWIMISETLLKGQKFCYPLIPLKGLSSSLVEPALKHLERNNVFAEYSQRVTAITSEDGSITSITVNKKQIKLDKDDLIILAIPPKQISTLLPDINVPTQSNTIINIHYRIDDRPPLPTSVNFIGLIGGNADWIFQKNDIYSVTISSANSISDLSNNDIAKIIWDEIAQIFEKDTTEIPINRVIREYNATIKQSPKENKKRPDSQTNFKNLVLAGDWTNTGLPATIESAVISGQKAAQLIKNIEIFK